MTITFSDLGLGPSVLKAIADVGYDHPTPIQAEAIPVALMNRDILGCAQTGTGKTASFTLPMIEALADGRAKARMPRSLILEPTRELAAQVAENFELYGKYHKLTMALLIGGVAMDKQEQALARGVDVLIATPGRLIDHMERGAILMQDIGILVIDEADRMLDMGFIPDIEKIVGALSPIRQTLLYSATMPKEIRRLADRFLHNPKEITVAPPASPAETVDQHLSIVPSKDKRNALRTLLDTHDIKNAIIFCNRKRDVDVVATSLKRHGYKAGAIHGDLDQATRTATLERFKNDEINLLVASDVAARGIDIQGLSHVFNFDVPIHADDYVHRIGRTGRAGMPGCAFMLATPEDTKFVQAIEDLTKREIPRHAIEGFGETALEEVEDKPRRSRGRRAKPAKETADKAPEAASEATVERDGAEAKPKRSRRKREDDGDLPTKASDLPAFVTVGPRWRGKTAPDPRPRSALDEEDPIDDTADAAPTEDVPAAPLPPEEAAAVTAEPPVASETETEAPETAPLPTEEPIAVTAEAPVAGEAETEVPETAPLPAETEAATDDDKANAAKTEDATEPSTPPVSDPPPTA